MIETHLLETFVTVVQTGSVSKAAEALYRSQPAISHRIRELESILEIPLFERVGRNIRPTPAAMRFYDESLELVIKLRELPTFAERYRDDISGTVTIGSFPTLGRHYLFGAITKMMQTHPSVKVKFRFAISDDIVDALRKTELDLIVAIGDLPTRGLQVEKLGSIDIVAAMSPELRKQLGKKLTIPGLRSLRYIAWRGPWDPSFETIDQYAKKHKLDNDHTAEIPHIETLRALASEGVGYALLPRYVCQEDIDAGRLVVESLPRFSTTFPIFVATRENQVLSPAAEEFRSYL